MLNIHDTNHTKATRPPLAMPLWSLEECQSTNKTSQKTLLQASISDSLSLTLSPFLSATHPKARPGPAPWELLQPAKPTPACIIIIFHQLCKRCPAECACNRAPSGPAPKRMQMSLPAGANWPPPLPVSAAYRDSLSCVSSSPEPWTHETSSSKPHGPALLMFVYRQMFLSELFIFAVFWKFKFLDMNLIQ